MGGGEAEEGGGGECVWVGKIGLGLSRAQLHSCTMVNLAQGSNVPVIMSSLRGGVNHFEQICEHATAAADNLVRQGRHQRHSRYKLH